MKPVGPILKEYIEEKKLAKTKVAEKVGITYNYLSTIFKKDSVDAALLEKLCVAIGLSPMTFYEYGSDGHIAHYQDIQARTQIGSAAVNINNNGGDTQRLLEIIEEKNRLIEEKERTIKILMAASGLKLGTDSGQNKD